MSIQLRTLGSLDLRAPDGHEIRSLLAQPKRFALLAYLATSPGGFQRRDTLLALFWPGSDADSARASLRTALSVLRRSLGEGAVVTRGNDEVGVDSERLWCDVAAFEQALAAGAWELALELYRGDLLQGFHLDDTLEFDRWLDERRTGLRARAAGAAWKLAE
jgi:DNA-binding SARP family transcriptional activator